MNGWFRKQGFNAVLSHKEQMKDERKKVIVKILKECQWFKYYQQRNVFTFNGGSNEKLYLKLAAPKFRK